MLYEALDNKVFTGAATCVSEGRQIILNECLGRLGDIDTPPLTHRTLFDLASLTKVVSTTLAWMILAAKEDGILDAHLGNWFDSIPSEKALITPRHLLAHISGLPAWRPYYLVTQSSETRNAMVSRILAEPLEYPVGQECIYSDLGFILLGRMLELYWKKDLDTLCREQIYVPLGLEHDLLFKPDPKEHSIVWTRWDDPPGTVNDLNARAMGGVAGHAGLFGTATGLTKVAEQVLGSLVSLHGFFPHETAKSFCTRLNAPNGITRTLGFDTPSLEGSSSGTRFSNNSIGHTGFTGTSIWIDPVKQVVVTLLTNRVFMGEADPRIKLLRPMFHDAIMEEIMGGESSHGG
jgi:CubicO group peptidase (beta-lactamase class C family)